MAKAVFEFRDHSDCLWIYLDDGVLISDPGYPTPHMQWRWNPKLDSIELYDSRGTKWVQDEAEVINAYKQAMTKKVLDE